MGTVVKRLQRGTSCEYLKSHQILGMIHSNFITKCEFSSQEAKTCLCLNSSHLVCLFHLAKLLKLQEINWLKRLPVKSLISLFGHFCNRRTRRTRADVLLACVSRLVDEIYGMRPTVPVPHALSPCTLGLLNERV